MRKHLLFVGLVVLTGFRLSAGTYTTDFNSGTPPNLTLFGNAVIAANGGFTNSGVLKLTTATNNQSGSCIIGDLDNGQPVYGLRASFKALVGGGTAADGFSFNFASDLPAGGFAEEGAGTGLTISFDTFVNGTETTPTIDVKIGSNTVASASVTSAFIRQNTFVDVVVNVRPNGLIDVIYDGTYVHSNVNSGYTPISGGQFGFGARTGGQNDNHFIDNLSIATITNSIAYLDTVAPLGRNVRPDATVNVVLQDNNTLVQTNSIQLLFDGTDVTSSAIISQSSPATTITYDPPGLLPGTSTHNVSVTFSDNAANVNTFRWGFSVPGYSTLPTNLLAAPTVVDLNAPGFFVRFSQVGDNTQPGNLLRAEQQLAGMIIDPNTGAPMENIASPDSVFYTQNVVATNVTSYSYVETNVINYGTGGNFNNDMIMPGLPGSTGDSHNYALDAVAYLYLAPGFYDFGVNSADGFRLTAAATADIFAPVESVFDGPRPSGGDNRVTFGVTQGGYYPFRLLYMIDQKAVFGVPDPGTEFPVVEFYAVDINGNKALVNDSNTPGYIQAYRPAATLPYVRAVDPVVGETGVSRSAPIDITMVDGSITIQTNTIQLKLAGVDVTSGLQITGVTTNGENLTLLRYQSPALLGVNSNYVVQIAYTDSASTRRTNTYTFTTENILSPLWIIPPNQTTNTTLAKWVTTGSTERGLAYNPKTGHVLLVSRSTATGADGPNSKGIAVLDGDTGLYIKQLAAPSGGFVGGTFALNLIDVAEDGVIYAASLATSASSPFKIYRWQNEDDANPVLAFNGFPTASAGTPRWGDSFCVRNSGAGTQIIASGNNASVNSIPLFTTVDGTNFNVTLVAPTSLPNNSARLGLAFGCGNTIYGKDNASTTPLQYSLFTGAPATTGSRLAAYDIVDILGNEGIGPIGVDIGNQRLMGDTTIGGTTPHSLSLFDLDQLATTGQNRPIDSKSYATSTGSFGTGAVDFSPDGTRVYALDTGNGVIAFKLAPKLAAPTICAQPQNYIITNFGSVAYFGVQPIGSSMSYRWLKNGSNIGGATNRTLDIYNVQLSDLGRYSVIASNSLGSVTSSIVYLDFAMVITNQPGDQIIPVGGSTSFSIGVDGGSGGYTYQWRKNGVNIAGQTNSSISIVNAQTSDAGGYSVSISDSVGQTILSATASLTVGSLGSGTGLTGEYYSNQTNFAGLPVLTRVDPTVNFNFGTGSPDPAISVDNFAVRWTGQVQPLYTQPYTFYVTSDDGSRLWVNGQKLIDKWKNQAPTESSGTVTLTANQKYDIILEYYEKSSGATVTLSWGSTNQVKQIIPQSQLYPSSTSPTQPIMTVTSTAGGTNQIFNWSGSYVLQSSTNVSGPYIDVPGATGPYTNAFNTDPQRFFRLISE